MASNPCPSCGEEMAVGGNKKPYLACKPCGVQTMIRGKAGVEKFEAKGNDWRKGSSAPAPASAKTATPNKEADRAGTPSRKTLDEEFSS